MKNKAVVRKKIVGDYLRSRNLFASQKTTTDVRKHPFEMNVSRSLTSNIFLSLYLLLVLEVCKTNLEKSGSSKKFIKIRII